MRSPWRLARSSWGDRAVLVLVGSRLKGVNPYCGAIKALFTFPQSAGIAGASFVLILFLEFPSR
ncbi:hypothetical protein EDC04DRAFT_2793303 [Pisolithus marmoratus]|nr:hypothetical protein EDC04DRAFT_2793303 [Pisolithus marmoratus]